MIEWTNKALDTAAAKLTGRGYYRYANKDRKKIREEIRDMLNAVIEAQGCVSVSQDVFDQLEKNSNDPESLSVNKIGC